VSQITRSRLGSGIRGKTTWRTCSEEESYPRPAPRAGRAWAGCLLGDGALRVNDDETIPIAPDNQGDQECLIIIDT
jgi:hypothetical protein